MCCCFRYTVSKEEAREFPLPDDGHKIFGFLVGFLLVFRSTIAHKRFTDGIAKLGELENHALELARKVCMYASEGSGGWKDEEQLVKLAVKREELRRLTVQFVVLAAVDIMRDINDQVQAETHFGSKKKPEVVSVSETQSPLTGAAAEDLATPRFVTTAHAAKWLEVARSSSLFTSDEVRGGAGFEGGHISRARRHTCTPGFYWRPTYPYF